MTIDDDWKSVKEKRDLVEFCDDMKCFRVVFD